MKREKNSKTLKYLRSDFEAFEIIINAIKANGREYMCFHIICSEALHFCNGFSRFFHQQSAKIVEKHEHIWYCVASLSHNVVDNTFFLFYFTSSHTHITSNECHQTFLKRYV